MNNYFKTISGFFWLTTLLLSQISHTQNIQSGFSWTHEDIFVSKAQGSDLANIHIYGWGTLWAFPDGEPGEFDGGAVLDSRIAKAHKNQQDIMLTLATAPSSFRTSGKPWNMEEKVSPEYEDLYIQRIQSLLKNRHQVKYVQVWNEFKGYWNFEENRWDYEANTNFYNKMYKAIRFVRPDIRIGGGYVVFNKNNNYWDTKYNGVEVDSRAMDALKYWLNNAVNFDAICLDAYLDPGDFSKITNYVKSLPESQKKPIWWSEFYNKSGSMFDCATDIVTSLEPGDKLLWWAEDSWLPYKDPINQIIKDGSYYITSPKNNQRLAAPIWNSHNAIMNNPNNNHDQRWFFEHLKDDIYSIKNEGANRFLEVTDALCNNLSNVGTWISIDYDNQKWKLSKNKNETYSLQPLHCLEKGLDREKGNFDASAILWDFQVKNPNQQWEIILSNFKENDYHQNHENSQKGHVKIYPNPVSNIMYLQGITKSDIVTVYSLKGEKLATITIIDENKIPIDTLDPGTYIISISGKKTTSIIVKK